MNKEIKEKWVNALRSGAYTQGCGALRNDIDGGNKYCCLGVLCDLHSKETNTKWREAHPYVYTYLKLTGALPVEVMTWAELSYDNPLVKYTTNDGRSYLSLASANDGGVDFQTIANVIEAQL